MIEENDKLDPKDDEEGRANGEESAAIDEDKVDDDQLDDAAGGRTGLV